MTRHLVTTVPVRARSTLDSLVAATNYACEMDGMFGVAVAQEILDQPEIVAPIRQSEAAGVPRHVRMDRRQSGQLGLLWEFSEQLHQVQNRLRQLIELRGWDLIIDSGRIPDQRHGFSDRLPWPLSLTFVPEPSISLARHVR